LTRWHSERRRTNFTELRWSESERPHKAVWCAPCALKGCGKSPFWRDTSFLQSILINGGCGHQTMEQERRGWNFFHRREIRVTTTRASGRCAALFGPPIVRTEAALLFCLRLDAPLLLLPCNPTYHKIHYWSSKKEKSLVRVNVCVSHLMNFPIECCTTSIVNGNGAELQSFTPSCIPDRPQRSSPPLASQCERWRTKAMSKMPAAATVIMAAPFLLVFLVRYCFSPFWWPKRMPLGTWSLSKSCCRLLGANRKFEPPARLATVRAGKRLLT
jgi:hypothetical protein